VHLQMGGDLVDWNRHPAKTEIYLRQMEFWQAQIAEAITQMLQLASDLASESYQMARVQHLLKVSESSNGYQVHPQERSLPSELPLTLRVVSQVLNTYILVEHPGGLWLVEQHIAHERVLYEQLCDRWQLITLEPPIILTHLSNAQREQLERLGITVESFGENLWAVRHAPALLAERDDCAAALLELSLGVNLQAAQVATACRSAIRNGAPLSLRQMQSLIEQWQHTRNPRTCPHGRPIYLSLEESALARFFRRHWVLGKSHGI
jgi:DNA mismatch repair protein MutL